MGCSATVTWIFFSFFLECLLSQDQLHAHAHAHAHARAIPHSHSIHSNHKSIVKKKGSGTGCSTSALPNTRPCDLALSFCEMSPCWSRLVTHPRFSLFREVSALDSKMLS